MDVCDLDHIVGDAVQMRHYRDRLRNPGNGGSGAFELEPDFVPGVPAMRRLSNCGHGAKEKQT